MRSLITISLILLFALTGFSVIAQDEKIEVKFQKDSVIPMNGEKVQKLKAVNLSDEQKKQEKKHRKNSKVKKQAIKKNIALTEVEKQEKLKQLKKNDHDTLQAILTPQQKIKLKQMKKNSPQRGVTDKPNERTVK